MNSNLKKEYGDYQTPYSFTKKICVFLSNYLNIKPSIIIEPTCGKGHFIQDSLTYFNPEKIIGLEINKKYCDECKQHIDDSRVEIINTDVFDYDFKDTGEETLIIGNPPWITNSELSLYNSTNLPAKSNTKGLNGLDAMLGSSNFDICESMILKLIEAFKNTSTIIALLCKRGVARNVYSEMMRTHINYSYYHIYEFDSRKVFNIDASACLIVINLNSGYDSECKVYSLDEPDILKDLYTYKEGNLYNLSKHDFDGKCIFEWRQGIKHDCSSVLELTFYTNKLNEEVMIEEDYVYPLIKSSMIKKPITNRFNKYVIVTQSRLKEDTTHIKEDAPRTWEYLESHKAYFERRKSSIYKNCPSYSIFGIGNYAFKKYKVGVSGFYKKPMFSLIYSDKPVMLDDTCYYVGFDDYDEAYIFMLILNSKIVQDYLLSIAFLDNKRPYTKKVLKRVDLNKILDKIDLSYLLATESSLGLDSYINEDCFEIFKKTV